MVRARAERAAPKGKEDSVVGAEWNDPDRRHRGPVGPNDIARIRVTNADRDAVAERLKEAYSDGQLDDDEFNHRLDLTMGAKIHGDLAPLVADLATRSTPDHTPYAPRPPAMPESEPTGGQRVWAAAGHVSAYFTSVIGPLVVLLCMNHSRYVRRHAMEALNYQLMILIASILVVPVGILTLGIGFLVYALLIIGWVIFPAIAGVVALAGARWRYPFTYRLIRDQDEPPGPS